MKITMAGQGLATQEGMCTVTWLENGIISHGYFVVIQFSLQPQLKEGFNSQYDHCLPVPYGEKLGSRR